MIIPLETDRPLRRPRLITPILVVVNVLVYLLSEFFFATGSPAVTQAIYHYGVLAPGSEFRWWNLVTYAFLHAGWWHLIGNMLILWVLGPNVEDKFGRVRFLLFYLIGGAFAGGMHVLLEHTRVVGASGANAAVCGAFLVMFPRTHLKVFILFIYIGVFNLPAWMFLAPAIVWDLLLGGMANQDRIAHLAHLGGYAFGIGLCLALLGLKLMDSEPFDLFSVIRQAKRRREIKEAVTAAQGKAPAIIGASADQALLEHRAEILRLLGAGDAAGAIDAYERLQSKAPPVPVLTLPPRWHLELSNHAFSRGMHTLAAVCYDRFVRGYPDSSDTPKTGLMLALVRARYLHDPAGARAALEAIAPAPTEPDQRALFDQLKAEVSTP